ncbi:hypothetical protein YC2023_052423 [Brassica napus]
MGVHMLLLDSKVCELTPPVTGILKFTLCSSCNQRHKRQRTCDMDGFWRGTKALLVGFLGMGREK